MADLESAEAACRQAQEIYDKALAPLMGPSAVPIELRRACTQAWLALIEARAAVAKATGPQAQ